MKAKWISGNKYFVYQTYPLAIEERGIFLDYALYSSHNYF
jgi:hypothetical protein